MEPMSIKSRHSPLISRDPLVIQQHKIGERHNTWAAYSSSLQFRHSRLDMVLQLVSPLHYPHTLLRLAIATEPLFIFWTT
jgi:hypothetical protein